MLIYPFGVVILLLTPFELGIALQNADGSGYSQYADALKALAQHEADMNVTVYKQIWNEPDLTSYFNYSAGGVTFFHGTNTDYNEMYAAASTAMAVSFST